MLGKIRYIKTMFGIMVLLLVAVGCKSEAKAPASGELAYKETLLDEQDVVKALEENEVKLTADSSASYFELNKVKPTIFALPDQEKIMVYVYGSDKDTQEARQDFAEQTKLMDMNAPLFYNVKNALILYQHQVSNSTPKEKTAYHSNIEQAIEQLLGDEIYVKLGKPYNLPRMEQFIDNFNDHKADQLKITALTIEGDPIYTYLITDGTKLQYVNDNREDTYGGDKGISKTECTAIEKQNKEENTVYTVTGCQDENERYVMAVPGLQ
ncbi:DUF4362 domain-containing protein [Paenibacillus glycanilyticus]|uniref:DUF4362 domain-containing protein n=1 Tax=Paenibacillus glycanilyticus TaxID=126569 RepID=A0ABQ6GI50_9BACL|nr:DUF4362 domain-containing protein [Paenibacillus glycanilyticus]GLX69276.1 hypothetical protein MU1_36210 [Paenibacillus glycanilyticus]